MKYFYPLIISFLLFSSACKDTYTGKYPEPPTCEKLTPTDTVEEISGIVRLEDTTSYIATYVDENTVTKYYPCSINLAYEKEGFPLVYSGIIRKREGDKKQYITLSYAQPILNETIITNYKGLVRNRDSAKIDANEKTGVIKSFKLENNKLKLLITYKGCNKGRTVFLSLYKTTKESGVTKASGFLTSPYETCQTEYTLWYEINVEAYKDHTLLIADEVKTHEFIIPK